MKDNNNHNSHIKDKNYAKNIRSCKECNNKNKNRCRKLCDANFHEYYMTDDCEKYSISLLQEGDNYSIQNTGTLPLCRKWFLCSKNFKTEGCFEFLNSNESFQLQNLDLNTYVVAFAQVDKKNWVRSNSFILTNTVNFASQSSIQQVNRVNEVAPLEEVGATISYSTSGGQLSIRNNNVVIFSFIHNISDVDAYDVTFELEYDKSLFIVTPGIIAPNFQVTTDNRIIGFIPFFQRRTRITGFNTLNRSVTQYYNPAYFQIQGVYHVDIKITSSSTNIIYENQTNNPIFTAIFL